MAEQAVLASTTPPISLPRRIATGAARQRELSLAAVMVILALLVSLRAPQLFSASNVTQVSVIASIIGIAAVGQALVILTRNIDLSVESTIGLVAFIVAETLAQRALDVPFAIAMGIGVGLLLGMVNGVLVALLRVPSIVATLGTLSIYRGVDFLIAGGKQVTLTDLPAGYTAAARGNILGVPLFLVIAVAIIPIIAVVLRQTTFGRQVYAVGSNPEAAEILGIRARLITFVVFSLCGLLAGVAGVLWGIEFGTINATAATGVVLQIVAACVVGGVNIFGGSGTVIGAGLGSLFLAFISNALILVRLSQFWLGAIYGAVILVAVAIDSLITRRLAQSTSVRRPVVIRSSRRSAG